MNCYSDKNRDRDMFRDNDRIMHRTATRTGTEGDIMTRIGLGIGLWKFTGIGTETGTENDTGMGPATGTVRGTDLETGTRHGAGTGTRTAKGQGQRQ